MTGPRSEPRRARFALGLAVLGRPAYINTGLSRATADRSVTSLRANTFAVLDAAVAAGIDWVDTARSYGLAEQFLGDWFADRHPQPAPTVSSKWGYAYVGQWRLDAPVHEVKEHSLARFRQQWQESRHALPGVIGLYQVHSLTPDSPLLTDPDLLAALAELVEDDVAVGFSTTGPSQPDTVRRALEIRVAGRPLFAAVQSTWNLWETSAGPALAEAAEAGLAVIVKEALANGRLVSEAPNQLRTMAARHGVGPDAVALAAALALPFVDRVLLGPADPAQLAGNLAAAHLRLGENELAELAGLARPAAGYWSARSALAWQ